MMLRGRSNSPDVPRAVATGRGDLWAAVKRSFVVKVMLEPAPDVSQHDNAITVSVTGTGLLSLFVGIEAQLGLAAGLAHGTMAGLMLTEAAPSRLVPSVADAGRWTHIQRPQDGDDTSDAMLALLPVSFICIPKWAPRSVSFSVCVAGVGRELMVVNANAVDADRRSNVLHCVGQCSDCTSLAALQAAIEAAVELRVDMRDVAFANRHSSAAIHVADGLFEPLRHVAQLAPSCCLRVNRRPLPLGAGPSPASERVLDALQLRCRVAATPLVPLDNSCLFLSEAHVVSGTMEALRRGLGRPATAAEGARSPGRDRFGSSAAVEIRMDPAAWQRPFQFAVGMTPQTPVASLSSSFNALSANNQG